MQPRTKCACFNGANDGDSAWPLLGLQTFATLWGQHMAAAARRCEDDLTYALGEVVKANNRLRRQEENGAPQHIIREFAALLQHHIVTMFDNTKPGLPVAQQRSGRPLKSISQRLKARAGPRATTIRAHECDGVSCMSEDEAGDLQGSLAVRCIDAKPAHALTSSNVRTCCSSLWQGMHANTSAPCREALSRAGGCDRARRGACAAT